MRIPAEWAHTHEFACHATSCAPPPAGSGGSLPGTHGGDHKAAYLAMKKREAQQALKAQTNRARANYGMAPLK